MLADRIWSGEWSVGNPLPPLQSLADDWQVSRTVVREAVARLAAKGLVISRQGRGVFVAEPREGNSLELSTDTGGDNLLRIIELRMAIEVEGAALAALRRGDADLAGMANALAGMAEGIESNDIAAGAAADLAFHRSVLAATGNRHYLALFVFFSQSFYENISVSRRNSASLAGRGHEAQREHEVLFEAIRSADPGAARAAARTHIENTARRLGLALYD